jgi:hypothetical protein
MFSYASEICIEKALSDQWAGDDADILTSAPADLGRVGAVVPAKSPGRRSTGVSLSGIGLAVSFDVRSGLGLLPGPGPSVESNGLSDRIGSLANRRTLAWALTGSSEAIDLRA